MSDTLDELGPIDYLIVEFPEGRVPDGSALAEVLDLVERGIIRVLDLTFVQCNPDGTTVQVDLADLDLDGDFDVALFSEASSGLLGAEDVADAAAALEPGHSAAILIYENRWAAAFAAALRRSGAQLVANGRIPVNALLESLDA